MSDSIANPRPAPPRLILVLLGAVVGCSILVNQWFIPSRIWQTVFDATYGILHPTLLGGVIVIAVQGVIILILIGKFRPSEIGLEASKLPSALLAVLIIWTVLQLTSAVLSVIAGTGPEVRDVWTSGKASFEIGKLVAQLGGNALAEEITFRGFLLGQCLILTRRWIGGSGRKNAVVATLACSALFALSHIPNRLMKDAYPDIGSVLGDQAMLLFLGSVFCMMYLSTRNLLFVVGAHALMNRPTMLLATPDRLDPADQVICLLLAIVVTFCWPPRTPKTRTNVAPDLDR